MSDLAARLRPIWPLLALICSGALLAAAHAFERFGGLAPCPLCLDQRKWHWAVVGVAAAAFVISCFVRGRERIAAAVIGLVLLGAAGMAAYHVAVEQHWVIAQCDARLRSNDFTFNPNAKLEIPRCDTPAWVMFGISMAGYNALASLGLALASFFVAFAPVRRDA